jgi:hypothetical protein
LFNVATNPLQFGTFLTFDLARVTRHCFPCLRLIVARATPA